MNIQGVSYPTLGSTTIARGLTMSPAVKVARCDPLKFATCQQRCHYYCLAKELARLKICLLWFRSCSVQQLTVMLFKIES